VQKICAVLYAEFYILLTLQSLSNLITLLTFFNVRVLYRYNTADMFDWLLVSQVPGKVRLFYWLVPGTVGEKRALDILFATFIRKSVFSVKN
jgi:hypothetical protein